MSAETLRRAAELLRERGTAASPGPWMVKEPHQTWLAADVVFGPSSWPGHIEQVGNVKYGRNQEADGPYIALMHPPVALALADWLDVTAQAMADSHAADPDDPVELSDEGEAVAVARAILREDG